MESKSEAFDHSDIAAIRTDYKRQQLLEASIASDPMDQFDIWWQQAIKSHMEEVNAMTLATSSIDGLPDARIVLLKNITAEGFVFFTNYESAKGRQLIANPRAALVFFWKDLERQVRIRGTVKKISPQQSDQYFQSRPAGSRIGAWSSPQSRVISSREILESNEDKFKKEYGDHIPRPPHWGGFVVVPSEIEFWQGRPSRLHDRILYTKDNEQWKISRLAP